VIQAHCSGSRQHCGMRSWLPSCTSSPHTCCLSSILSRHEPCHAPCTCCHYRYQWARRQLSGRFAAALLDHLRVVRRHGLCKGKRFPSYCAAAFTCSKTTLYSMAFRIWARLLVVHLHWPIPLFNGERIERILDLLRCCQLCGWPCHRYGEACQRGCVLTRTRCQVAPRH
jgi:hypothetical protein